MRKTSYWFWVCPFPSPESPTIRESCPGIHPKFDSDDQLSASETIKQIKEIPAYWTVSLASIRRQSLDLVILSLVMQTSTGGPMPTAENAICPRQRAYRRRLAAAGEQEGLLRLSNETVALIDEIKERQGLRNRGQVLEQLIEKGRTVFQQ